ncbi:type I toxin-antitoxin system Ibs family toxin [Citrobacter freundii]|nr:type I toxin-antitoxin system Ibs family toxin [Citrobacter freundii]
MKIANAKECARVRTRQKEVSQRFQPEISARDFSRTLKRESPSRGRGQNKERVMMKYVIILVILLVISFAAY